MHTLLPALRGKNPQQEPTVGTYSRCVDPLLCVHLNTQVVALAAGFLWQWWASYKGFNVSATHSISESRLSALLTAAAVLAALFCRVMLCPVLCKHDTCGVHTRLTLHAAAVACALHSWWHCRLCPRLSGAWR